MEEKKKSQKEKWTIVSALEHVYLESQSSGLSEEFYKSVKGASNYLAKRLGFNPFQSACIAMMVNEAENLTLKRISRSFSCPLLSIMKHNADIMELESRKIIRRSRFRIGGSPTVGFFVNPEFVKAVLEDREFVATPESDYTIRETLQAIYNYLELAEDISMYNTSVEAVMQILKATTHLTMSRQLLSMKLSTEELLLFLMTAYAQIVKKHPCIKAGCYDELMDCSDSGADVIRELDEGNNRLNDLKLMENVADGEFASPGDFRITQYAFDTIFPDLNFHYPPESGYESNALGVIKPEDIGAKNLYYNDRESSQVGRLTELLTEDTFADIQNRLLKANMRSGFACLFYGSPGTGKTETVLQIGRQTGRQIFQVNMSELRSKWVGDSEKNVKAIFERYRWIKKSSPLCPILLFNEADAIISKRSKNVERSVDKMENSIQNILLQELEQLDGILIATTNLTDNMDPAFERRFLYKVQFDKPSSAVKAKIWQSILPELNQEDASRLSCGYDFSGGQIENIARKSAIDNILYGTPAQYDTLQALCEEESICGSSTYHRVGFA